MTNNYEKTFNKGERYFSNERAEKALVFYEKCISIDPTRAEGYMQAGSCYGKLGNLKKALEYTNKAIEIDPNSSIANFNLAQIFLTQNKKKEAKECLKIAVNLKIHAKQAYGKLAEILVDEGNITDAYSYLLEAVNKFPAEKEFYFYLGSIIVEYQKQFGLSRLSDALKYLEKASDLGFNSPEILYYKGVACYMLRKWQEALQYLSEYLSHAEDKKAAMMLASSLLWLGYVDKAKELLEYQATIGNELARELLIEQGSEFDKCSERKRNNQDQILKAVYTK